MSTTLPAAPARRLQPPSWRDPRLIGGLLLVLLSVAGTTRLVAAADRTVPVVAAARPLVPGQRVQAADLQVVQVSAGEAAAAYLDGSQGLPDGQVATRDVRAGELVPRSALAGTDAAARRTVTVPVDRTALDVLTVGALVDVWVSPRNREAAGEHYGKPVRLLARVPVARVPDSGTGMVSSLQGVAVQLLVPDDKVADLITHVDQQARVTLVPVPGSATRTDE